MSNGQGLYTAADASRWSANAGSIGRTGAKAGGLAIIADSPSRLSNRGGTTGFERFLLVIRTILMSVVTAVTWQFVPAVGVILAILGTFFTARAVAAMGDTPLPIGTFARLVKRTVNWRYLAGGLALVAVTVLHRSVVLEWIPAGLREWSFWLASAVLIVAIVGSAVLGRMAIVEFRNEQKEAQGIEVALAKMLGASRKALFYPDAYGDTLATWQWRGQNIFVDPPDDLDLTGIETRLLGTSLATRFSVAPGADHDGVLLTPITPEALERVQTLRASGGIVESVEDLSAPRTPTDPIAAFEPDADDPWGDAAMPAPSAPTNDGDNGTVSFGEEAWS